MSRKPHQTIAKHFQNLKDPRTGNAKQHALLDIIIIAICAAICGADNWVEVEVWEKANQRWLRTFPELPHGIPSHDTFRRIVILLDPNSFAVVFSSGFPP